jgi:hypothetical protein
MLIMGVFTLALADEEKLLVPASMTRRLRLEAVIWFVSSGVFLISAVPIFGKVDVGGHLVTGVSLRIILWLGAIVIAWATWGMERSGSARERSRTNPTSVSGPSST